MKLAAKDLELDHRLRGISLELTSHDCVVVTGPNGSGKSSLLRALLGLEQATAGRVELGERSLDDWSRAELARALAWLPQNVAPAEPLLVEQLVENARYRFTESRGAARQAARGILDSLGALHLAERATHRISGGELQRVLLAALLAQDTPLLLVDEPGNHLDPRQQASVYRELGRAWRAGRGLLVVTHELGLAHLLGEPEKIRVLCLVDGRVAVDETLGSPRLASALETATGVPYRKGTEPGRLSIAWEQLG